MCQSGELNQQVGEKIAFDNAFRGLWPLLGFLLAEKNKLRSAA
jgi:Phage protein (N4 Gp49/phage Sf6 gene 66) family